MASKTYYYAYVGKVDIEEQMIILERLKDYSNGWCSIQHDRDDTDTHIHFMFSTYLPIKKLQENLEKEFHLEQVQNKRAYSQYMLHKTEKSKEDGKAEYSLKDMEFSSSRFASDLGLRQQAEQTDIEDKARILFKICNSCRTYTQLVNKSIEFGVYDELRRGFSMWKEVFTETRFITNQYEKHFTLGVSSPCKEEINDDVNLEEFFD